MSHFLHGFVACLKNLQPQIYYPNKAPALLEGVHIDKEYRVLYHQKLLNNDVDYFKKNQQ